eukprot:TRINITY_DN1080_c0_g1_i1.p1 TRINITY_DN1080_c0_g1~~TRINITY_DN1080_c0_g1_i1.p1  ORF type:complete len:4264 (+),score=1186.63 TRINITY_DN1080_c0_g1_i1:298-12792(+)
MTLLNSSVNLKSAWIWEINEINITLDNSELLFSTWNSSHAVVDQLYMTGVSTLYGELDVNQFEFEGGDLLDETILLVQNVIFSTEQIKDFNDETKVTVLKETNWTAGDIYGLFNSELYIPVNSIFRIQSDDVMDCPDNSRPLLNVLGEIEVNNDATIRWRFDLSNYVNIIDGAVLTLDGNTTCNNGNFTVQKDSNLIITYGFIGTETCGLTGDGGLIINDTDAYVVLDGYLNLMDTLTVIDGLLDLRTTEIGYMDLDWIGGIVLMKEIHGCELVISKVEEDHLYFINNNTLCNITISQFFSYLIEIGPVDFDKVQIGHMLSSASLVFHDRAFIDEVCLKDINGGNVTFEKDSQSTISCFVQNNGDAFFQTNANLKLDVCLTLNGGNTVFDHGSVESLIIECIIVRNNARLTVNQRLDKANNTLVIRDLTIETTGLFGTDSNDYNYPYNSLFIIGTWLIKGGGMNVHSSVSLGVAASVIQTGNFIIGENSTLFYYQGNFMIDTTLSNLVTTFMKGSQWNIYQNAILTIKSSVKSFTLDNSNCESCNLQVADSASIEIYTTTIFNVPTMVIDSANIHVMTNVVSRIDDEFIVNKDASIILEAGSQLQITGTVIVYGMIKGEGTVKIINGGLLKLYGESEENIHFIVDNGEFIIEESAVCSNLNLHNNNNGETTIKGLVNGVTNIVTSGKLEFNSTAVVKCVDTIVSTGYTILYNESTVFIVDSIVTVSANTFIIEKDVILSSENVSLIVNGGNLIIYHTLTHYIYSVKLSSGSLSFLGDFSYVLYVHEYTQTNGKLLGSQSIEITVDGSWYGGYIQHMHVEIRNTFEIKGTIYLGGIEDSHEFITQETSILTQLNGYLRVLESTTVTNNGKWIMDTTKGPSYIQAYSGSPRFIQNKLFEKMNTGNIYGTLAIDAVFTETSVTTVRLIYITSDFVFDDQAIFDVEDTVDAKTTSNLNFTKGSKLIGKKNLIIRGHAEFANTIQLMGYISVYGSVANARINDNSICLECNLKVTYGKIIFKNTVEKQGHFNTTLEQYSSSTVEIEENAVISLMKIQMTSSTLEMLGSATLNLNNSIISSLNSKLLLNGSLGDEHIDNVRIERTLLQLNGITDMKISFVEALAGEIDVTIDSQMHVKMGEFKNKVIKSNKGPIEFINVDLYEAEIKEGTITVIEKSQSITASEVFINTNLTTNIWVSKENSVTSSIIGKIVSINSFFEEGSQFILRPDNSEEEEVAEPIFLSKESTISSGTSTNEILFYWKFVDKNVFNGCNIRLFNGHLYNEVNIAKDCKVTSMQNITLYNETKLSGEGQLQALDSSYIRIQGYVEMLGNVYSEDQSDIIFENSTIANVTVAAKQSNILIDSDCEVDYIGIIVYYKGIINYEAKKSHQLAKTTLLLIELYDGVVQFDNVEMVWHKTNVYVEGNLAKLMVLSGMYEGEDVSFEINSGLVYIAENVENKYNCINLVINGGEFDFNGNNKLICTNLILDNNGIKSGTTDIHSLNAELISGTLQGNSVTVINETLSLPDSKIIVSAEHILMNDGQATFSSGFIKMDRKSKLINTVEGIFILNGGSIKSLVSEENPEFINYGELIKQGTDIVDVEVLLVNEYEALIYVKEGGFKISLDSSNNGTVLLDDNTSLLLNGEFSFLTKSTIVGNVSSTIYVQTSKAFIALGGIIDHDGDFIIEDGEMNVTVSAQLKTMNLISEGGKTMILRGANVPSMTLLVNDGEVIFKTGCIINGLSKITENGGFLLFEAETSFVVDNLEFVMTGGHALFAENAKSILTNAVFDISSGMVIFANNSFTTLSFTKLIVQNNGVLNVTDEDIVSVNLMQILSEGRINGGLFEMTKAVYGLSYVANVEMNVIDVMINNQLTLEESSIKISNSAKIYEEGGIKLDCQSILTFDGSLDIVGNGSIESTEKCPNENHQVILGGKTKISEEFTFNINLFLAKTSDLLASDIIHFNGRTVVNGIIYINPIVLIWGGKIINGGYMYFNDSTITILGGFENEGKMIFNENSILDVRVNMKNKENATLEIYGLVKSTETAGKMYNDGFMLFEKTDLNITDIENSNTGVLFFINCIDVIDYLTLINSGNVLINNSDIHAVNLTTTGGDIIIDNSNVSYSLLYTFEDTKLVLSNYTIMKVNENVIFNNSNVVVSDGSFIDFEVGNLQLINSNLYVSEDSMTQFLVTKRLDLINSSIVLKQGSIDEFYVNEISLNNSTLMIESLGEKQEFAHVYTVTFTNNSTFDHNITVRIDTAYLYDGHLESNGTTIVINDYHGSVLVAPEHTFIVTNKFELIANFVMSCGSSFTLESDASLVLGSGVGIVPIEDCPAKFINYGTIIKNDNGDKSFISVDLVNHGLIDIQQGEMDLNKEVEINHGNVEVVGVLNLFGNVVISEGSIFESKDTGIINVQNNLTNNGSLKGTVEVFEDCNMYILEGGTVLKLEDITIINHGLIHMKGYADDVIIENYKNLMMNANIDDITINNYDGIVEDLSIIDDLILNMHGGEYYQKHNDVSINNLILAIEYGTMTFNGTVKTGEITSSAKKASYINMNGIITLNKFNCNPKTILTTSIESIISITYLDNEGTIHSSSNRVYITRYVHYNGYSSFNNATIDELIQIDSEIVVTNLISQVKGIHVNNGSFTCDNCKVSYFTIEEGELSMNGVVNTLEFGLEYPIPPTNMVDISSVLPNIKLTHLNLQLTHMIGTDSVYVISTDDVYIKMTNFIINSNLFIYSESSSTVNGVLDVVSLSINEGYSSIINMNVYVSGNVNARGVLQVGWLSFGETSHLNLIGGSFGLLSQRLDINSTQYLNGYGSIIGDVIIGGILVVESPSITIYGEVIFETTAVLELDMSIDDLANKETTPLYVKSDVTINGELLIDFVYNQTVKQGTEFLLMEYKGLTTNTKFVADIEDEYAIEIRYEDERMIAFVTGDITKGELSGYYLAVSSGKDSDTCGAPSNPCKTFKFIYNTLLSGQKTASVIIVEDIYDKSGYIFGVNKNKCFVTIVGLIQNGRRPHIEGVLLSTRNTNIAFKDIIFDNFNRAAIFQSNAEYTLTNCDFFNCIIVQTLSNGNIIMNNVYLEECSFKPTYGSVTAKNLVYSHTTKPFEISRKNVFYVDGLKITNHPKTKPITILNQISSYGDKSIIKNLVIECETTIDVSRSYLDIVNANMPNVDMILGFETDLNINQTDLNKIKAIVTEYDDCNIIFTDCYLKDVEINREIIQVSKISNFIFINLEITNVVFNVEWLSISKSTDNQILLFNNVVVKNVEGSSLIVLKDFSKYIDFSIVNSNFNDIALTNTNLFKFESCDQVKLTISNTEFNNVRSNVLGVVFHASNIYSLNIDNTKFLNCESTSGGAFVVTQLFDMSNVLFENNVAHNIGGGFAILLDDDSENIQQEYESSFKQKYANEWKNIQCRGNKAKIGGCGFINTIKLPVLTDFVDALGNSAEIYGDLFATDNRNNLVNLTKYEPDDTTMNPYYGFNFTIVDAYNNTVLNDIEREVQLESYFNNFAINSISGKPKYCVTENAECYIEDISINAAPNNYTIKIVTDNIRDTNITVESYNCPVGYGYNEVLGRCDACAIGYYSLGETIECLKCPPGQYNSATGQSSCSPCPMGTYKGETDNECISCATVVDITGQTTFVSTDSGSGECKSCPMGMATINGVDCSCISSEYREVINDEGTRICVPCEDGLYCDGTELTCVLEGYTNNSLGEIEKCESSVGCQGTCHNMDDVDYSTLTLEVALQWEPTCAIGYSGRTCTKCDDGYMNMKPECVQCLGWMKTAIGSVLSILPFIFVTLLIKNDFKRNMPTIGHIRSFVFFVQILGLLRRITPLKLASLLHWFFIVVDYLFVDVTQSQLWQCVVPLMNTTYYRISSVVLLCGILFFIYKLTSTNNWVNTWARVMLSFLIAPLSISSFEFIALIVDDGKLVMSTMVDVAFVAFPNYFIITFLSLVGLLVLFMLVKWLITPTDGLDSNKQTIDPIFRIFNRNKFYYALIQFSYIIGFSFIGSITLFLKWIQFVTLSVFVVAILIVHLRNADFKKKEIQRIFSIQYLLMAMLLLLLITLNVGEITVDELSSFCNVLFIILTFELGTILTATIIALSKRKIATINNKELFDGFKDKELYIPNVYDSPNPMKVFGYSFEEFKEFEHTSSATPSPTISKDFGFGYESN